MNAEVHWNVCSTVSKLDNSENIMESLKNMGVSAPLLEVLILDWSGMELEILLKAHQVIPDNHPS